MKIYLTKLPLPTIYLLISFIFFKTYFVYSQCNESYNWVKWETFNGNNSTGYINNNKDSINIKMTTNYYFSYTTNIYSYNRFNKFIHEIPNTKVPKINWSSDSIGITTICFNKKVENPVLLISSLGSNSETVSLSFSLPYKVVYDGGGMEYDNNKTIKGTEGYAILEFSGEFECVSIYSSTPETYTNITWGLHPPIFPIKVIEKKECNSTTVILSGGLKYKWSEGIYKDSNINSFTKNGTYSVDITDSNNCTLKKNIDVIILNKTIKTSSLINLCNSFNRYGFTKEGVFEYKYASILGCDSFHTFIVKKDTFNMYDTVTICYNNSYMGFYKSGNYIIKNKNAFACDTIHFLNLNVNENIVKIVNTTICEGKNYKNHYTSGIFYDTFINNFGCDSIIKHILLVEPYLTKSILKTICKPASFNGYTKTGIYIDTIKSLNGCDTLYTIDLTVLEICEIFVANAFSPNNDNLNDVFKISSSTEINDFTLIVFNRWGEKLFESTDSKNGWDGKYKNKEVPDGVYFWICKYQFLNSGFKQVSGTVNLFY